MKQWGISVFSSLALLFLLFTSSARADELATVTGFVTDPGSLRIVGAKVQATNVETNVSYFGESNGEGLFRIGGIPTGSYRVVVQKTGFKTTVKQGLELHVQDIVSLNFQLEIGSVAESVTVVAEVPLVNTESAAVSTVVDQSYVKNMPLNGRSFQDLILLTPGVVTNSPQNRGQAAGTNGEFSVSGQRTESNYYTVDGVSANVGVVAGGIQTPGAGSLASSTSLGTTQSLVSVDALQEFRVQSSTYSAEYGRTPGAQFSLATRSGTNQWHGAASEYLRNDFVDANDWFNNFNHVAQPALRQNDFGGTLGGPVRVPGIYNGKDKTFFFFSYEGLRLIQPQAANISFVPNLCLRGDSASCAGSETPAASELQPVLNAFPMPNCASNPGCVSPIAGLDGFLGSWSNPSQLDSTSVRLDHSVSDKLKLFFRFSDTPSTTALRQTASAVSTPAVLQSTDFTARTYTFGATSTFSAKLQNEFRLNYSSNDTTSKSQITSFAGGQAVSLAQLQGLSTSGGVSYALNVNLGFLTSLQESLTSGLQRQWNLVDTVSLSLGRHQFKFGADYRRLTPELKQANPNVGYDYFAESSLENNAADFAFGFSEGPAYPLYTNFSAFAQDEWRVAPRLSLSMGLRWEVNPAPGATKGNVPYTVEGNSLSSLTLAPLGTPLWNTTWFNFAPRLGAAYILRTNPHFETVLRGGGGVFFDTGQQAGSQGYGGVGFSALNLVFGGAFPQPLSGVNPPITTPPASCGPSVPGCPYGQVLAFPRHLQLPYTLQWNASLEQGLGQSQALTVSYVGANGRRLLQALQSDISAINPNFTSLTLSQNGLTSDYDALELQFQRRLAKGLTALASYTWSHAIDFGSNNSDLAAIRGSSDYDVRHSFSAAFSYDLPTHSESKLGRAIFGNWGVDNRFTARTGFPVILVGPAFSDPATGKSVNTGLDLVPSQPIYVYGSQCADVYNARTGVNNSSCPGGRAINPNAFAPPAGCDDFFCPGPVAGNAPRNFVRGFGAWQMNLAVRREFPIHERLKLQFRAEAFNIFNHANFGTIDQFHEDPLFGQATATLGQSPGVLSSLYQTGGARSMQFALKLLF